MQRQQVRQRRRLINPICCLLGAQQAQELGEAVGHLYAGRRADLHEVHRVACNTVEARQARQTCTMGMELHATLHSQQAVWRIKSAQLVTQLACPAVVHM